MEINYVKQHCITFGLCCKYIISSDTQKFKKGDSMNDVFIFEIDYWSITYFFSSITKWLRGNIFDLFVRESFSEMSIDLIYQQYWVNNAKKIFHLLLMVEKKLVIVENNTPDPSYILTHALLVRKLGKKIT